MSRPPLLIGTIGVIVVLVLLLPIGCSGDDEGIPPGGPDPNSASCRTLLVEEPSWGSTLGGEAGTDGAFTSADWVWRRMTRRAFVVSGLPLVLGLGIAWVLGRRSRARGVPPEPLPWRFLLGAGAFIFLLLAYNFFVGKSN